MAGCSLFMPQYIFGFIDKTGAFIIEPQFGVAYPFNEGLAPVMMGMG
ncbi:MAG: WG repeat-containing protein, partial [Clostridiaceae bacterium]|nr:WG repeat-containing protein [Clostridiaceae bacterium]